SCHSHDGYHVDIGNDAARVERDHVGLDEEQHRQGGGNDNTDGRNPKDYLGSLVIGLEHYFDPDDERKKTHYVKIGHIGEARIVVSPRQKVAQEFSDMRCRKYDKRDECRRNEFFERWIGNGARNHYPRKSENNEKNCNTMNDSRVHEHHPAHFGRNDDADVYDDQYVRIKHFINHGSHNPILAHAAHWLALLWRLYPISLILSP